MNKTLSFPIGTYSPPSDITQQHISTWIKDIETLPDQIHDLVTGLSDKELSYSYRPEGWTIAQVVHHLADSHLNAYIRFKLAMTEDNPTIRPYNEGLWAIHKDATSFNLEYSLSMLYGLHKRWSAFLNSLSSSDLERTFYHPERMQSLGLAFTIGDYSWHGRHHTAHIQQALELQY